MRIDGRCHCGEIRYEAEVDPNSVLICHCTDCQALTGTAFRAVVAAPAAHFKLRSGTPKSYVKVAESGNKRRQAFCGNCGSPIYSCAVENRRAIRCASARLFSARTCLRRNRSGGDRLSVGWDRLASVPAHDNGFGGH